MEKNKDSLPTHLEEMLQSSTPFLASLFAKKQDAQTSGKPGLQRRKSSLISDTVGTQFRNNLSVLMANISVSDSCIAF